MGGGADDDEEEEEEDDITTLMLLLLLDVLSISSSIASCASSRFSLGGDCSGVYPTMVV